VPRWDPTGSPGEELGHHARVTHGPLSVGLWASPALGPAATRVPGGAGGRAAADHASRELLVCCWDACFEGGVYRFGGLDSTLNAGAAGRRAPGLFGFVEPVPALAPDALLAVSRDRPEVVLFPHQGAEPVPVELRFNWIRGSETLHVVRVCDVDRDGTWDLVIGTDSWAEYWPDGREWNDPQYRPFTAAGAWRGGPLLGHVYVARNTGTNIRPRFEPARALRAGDSPLVVSGTAAPAMGDFLGRGALDLICGDFLDRLWFFRHRGGLAFDPPVPVAGPDDRDLRLPQNIHVPVVVPPTGAGGSRRPALLVGAEDGLVHRLTPRPASRSVPAFSAPRPVRQPAPRLHPGILPVPCVCDWTGDGGRHLIVGTGGGWLLWYPDLRGDPLRRYGEPRVLRTATGPIRVQAGPTGSLQGPSEAKWGYLCPVVSDWDGDGRLEVLAGDIMERHLLFARTPDPEVLEPPRELRYRDVPLRTVWRVRPAVACWGRGSPRRYVCLDENGLLADYGRAASDPTALTDKRILRYADGAPIAFTEDHGGGRGRIKLAACDWTGEDRGDLLVGTHARASIPPGPTGAPRHTHGQATILLLENVGTLGAPTFARPRQICYRGVPVRYGMHACSPEPVDWTGRGVLDLVVGAESGTLFLLRREWLSW